MTKDLDRKTRPWFYLISFSMMIAGFVFHFNAWLIGGGLVIFMLIIFEDAKDQDAKKAKEVLKWDMVEIDPDGSFGPIHHLTAEVTTKEGKHEPRDRGTDESDKDQV